MPTTQILNDPEALAKLFLAYVSGDPAAADRFAAITYPVLLGYFRKSTTRPEEAEDLTQECFSRIHKSRYNYASNRPVLPWLFGIARHTRIHSFRYMRSRQHQEVAIHEENDIADPTQSDAIDALMAREVFTYLALLPPAQQSLLVLHYCDGYTQVEIAECLKIPANTAKQRIFRAKLALRAIIEDASRIATPSQAECHFPPRPSVPNKVASHPAPVRWKTDDHTSLPGTAATFPSSSPAALGKSPRR
jgi:RNA polymerase sigma factor (sigma-70 family)